MESHKIMNLMWKRSRTYASAGLGLAGAVLKHSLVPLPLFHRFLPHRGLVLDLGCGEGMLGNLLAASRPGVRLLGIDADGDKVRLAKQCASPNAEFEVGEILETDADGAACAILNDVLHHHCDERQRLLLAKTHSLLAENGLLLLKEVDRNDTFDRNWTKFWDSRLYPKDQLNFHDVSEWKKFLLKANFEVLAVQRVKHPWPASRTVLVCRRRKAQSVSLFGGSPRGSSESIALVTGASGFIGSQIVRELCRAGIGGKRTRVVALAREPLSLPEGISENVEIIEGDLSSLEARKESLQEVEYVFHFAALKDFFGGDRVLQENIQGTDALIRAFRGSTRLKRIIFASSMGAIDRAPNDPCTSALTEESAAFPTSQYGKAKLECEKHLLASGLPSTVLRLPWCYGPGMSPGTHLRSLCEMAGNGALLSKFYWPGRVSVLEVGECARAAVFLASSSTAKGSTYFVSDGEPISFGEVFSELGKMNGKQAGVVRIPALVLYVAWKLRRVLPFTLRCLLGDLLLVDDGKLRAEGFESKRRTRHPFLLLARYVTLRNRLWSPPESILVTGAAAGIGRALSVLFSALGAKVFLVDRDPRVLEVATEIPGSVARVSDLTSSGDRAELFELLRAEGISCIVNSAGIGSRGDLGTEHTQQLTKLLEVNITALTELTDFALRDFRKANQGVIVNLASSASFQPLPGMAVYAASKAYVSSLTQAIIAENNTRSGIVVIEISPGGVDTTFQQSAGIKKNVKERLLTPERVASTIVAAIRAGRSRRVCVGIRPHLMSLLARVLPSQANARLWQQLARKLR